MHKKHGSIRTQTKLFWKHTTLIISLSMIICTLLLSACASTSANSGPSGTSTPLATPAISATLRNQGEMQLQTFQQWITLMQQNGGDVTTYEQQYSSDQQALKTAKTSAQYTAALKTLDGHVNAIKIPAMKTESERLMNQLLQQTNSWGSQHKFHDSYNNKTYPLGYEYGSDGAAGDTWGKGEMNSAQTLADYQ